MYYDNKIIEVPKNVKIEIYHNCFKIYPFIKFKWNKETREEEGTCPKLEKALYKYERFARFAVRKDILNLYDRKSKTLTLPIGVGINFIEEKLYENNILYEKIDCTNKVIKPIEIAYKFNENYVIRDKYQAESITFLTSKDLFHSKMLALCTGRGKTFCAIAAAFRLKMPIFIVSETLTQQWMDRISDYTDCNKYNKGVRIVKGTENLHNLLNKPKEKVQCPFYISTSSSLSAYREKYGSLNPLMEHLGIGILCFDEYHMNWSQNVGIEMDVQTLHTWRLTATPSRTDSSEKTIFNRITAKIPVYGLQTFTLNNYCNIRLIDYDTNPNEYDIQKCITKEGLSGVLYWNYIFDNPNRMTYMLGMIKMLLDPIIDADPEAKVLIYLAKLKHINKFISMLEKLYEEENKKIDFGNYTTAIENKKLRRREIKKNIILTTIGSGGVGLDLENLVATFSLVPFSSSITANQMIGRLRYIEGKEVYHYDFIDTGFRTMKFQRMKRMSIYEQKSKHIAKKVISYNMVMEYLNNGFVIKKNIA